LDTRTERERRRHAAIDQRRSIERNQYDQLKVKIQTNLTKAGEKRLTERERKMNKLRHHISKVEEVCKEQAFRRQTSVENLRKEISERLDSASLKRELHIEAKKTIAMKSSEKKMQVIHSHVANSQFDAAPSNGIPDHQ
jgi:cell division protein FtsX